MSVPVQGVNPNPNSNNAQNNQRTSAGQNPKSVLESAMQAAQEAAKVIDTEAAFIGEKAAKAFKKADSAATLAQNPTDDIPMNDAALEAYAASIGESVEDVKRKRRKKLSTLSKTMDELTEMEGTFNEDEINEEDKGILQQFFDRMRQLRHVKKEIKRVQDEKKRYQEVIRQHERIHGKIERS